MREINKIIIHCSGTDSPLYDHDSIKKDHIENRMFNDIGYHFTVDQKGNIRFGRNIEIAGAHTEGQNSNSIGICFLGEKNFTSIQFTSGKELVKLIKRAYGNIPVYPHCMFNSHKTCPNFDIKEIL